MIGARTAEELAAAAGALAVLSGAVLGTLVRRSRSREADARRRAALLSEAGAVLDRRDPVGGLDDLARMAVPDLADVCLVDLRREGEGLQVAAVAAADPALGDALRELRGQVPG